MREADGPPLVPAKPPAPQPSSPAREPARVLASLAALPKARRRWARTDPTLARLVKEAPPGPREIESESAFDSLVSSIVHQQVSIAAGRSIRARLVEAAGGACTAEALLALGVDGMREAGLSRPKAAYAHDLARRVADGELDLDALERASDDEVVAQLTQVKGIGVWTAKMHLIFHMDRPDVLPHEDLGLQIAVARAYGVPRERTAQKMLELRPAWSPYCSLASLTLWNWRRVVPDTA